MQTNQSPHKGWWILVVLVLILFLVRFNFSFQGFVGRTVGVPANNSPGTNPPLYFVRQQYVEGVCAIAAMLLLLPLVGLTWKYSRQYSSMALWMASIWCLPAIVDVVIISLRSSNLMDPDSAVAGWNTLQEFLNDPLRRAAFLGTLVSCLVLALLLSWFGREKINSANATAALSNSG